MRTKQEKLFPSTKNNFLKKNFLERETKGDVQTRIPI